MLDAIFGAQDDVAIVVDGVLGKVDVAIESQEASHELIGRVGIFRQARIRNHGERDEQRFDVDEERKNAVSAAEPTAQRGFGEHFHGPSLRLEDAANVFQDHRIVIIRVFRVAAT